MSDHVVFRLGHQPAESAALWQTSCTALGSFFVLDHLSCIAVDAFGLEGS